MHRAAGPVVGQGVVEEVEEELAEEGGAAGDGAAGLGVGADAQALRGRPRGAFGDGRRGESRQVDGFGVEGGVVGDRQVEERPDDGDIAFVRLLLRPTGGRGGFP
ncbi:hypothetical protein [Streptomyces tsukubensis]|uniref:hypothetical protein n=1 Tax=Streptomyces tsukubensis TaxID=83656 RepID=UPI003450DBA5